MRFVLRPTRNAGIVIVLAMLALGTGGASAHDTAAAFAPTPSGPVYNGIPGALPPHFPLRLRRHLQRLADRGPFMPSILCGDRSSTREAWTDTACRGYHFGIDISIDDAHPETGAPGVVVAPGCTRSSPE